MPRKPMQQETSELDEGFDDPDSLAEEDLMEEFE